MFKSCLIHAIVNVTGYLPYRVMNRDLEICEKNHVLSFSKTSEFKY